MNMIALSSGSNGTYMRDAAMRALPIHVTAGPSGWNSYDRIFKIPIVCTLAGKMMTSK
jgi:hypothetical protein